MTHKLDDIISSRNLLATNIIHNIDKRDLLVFNKRLAPYELTFQQAIAILYIANHDDEPVYQKDLEKYMGLTNPTITSLVRRLIAGNFINKVKDEKDSRYFQLHLTKKSLELIDELAQIVREVNQIQKEAFSAEEYDHLCHLLLRLSDYMDRYC